MSISRYLSIFADFLSSSGVLGVAGGGTGLTSTPANGQLDIGNGTGFTRATLTAGTGITVTNGAGSISIASAVTQPQVYSQAFFSSGSWTAPTGVTRVRVWVVGGGGGGSTGGCGIYGGVGGMAMGVYTVSPGTGYTVTIGAGGAGASSGATGGTTSFGAFISATGGGGGTSNPGGSGSGSGGTVINSVGVSSGTSGSNIPNWSTPIAGSYSNGYSFNSGSAARVAGGTYPAGFTGSGTGGIGGMAYLEWVQ
jgi:hypothetical protein